MANMFFTSNGKCNKIELAVGTQPHLPFGYTTARKKQSGGTVAQNSRQPTCGLLICTLISENQGFEKSRSASNLRKNSGPANLDFFLGLHLKKS